MSRRALALAVSVVVLGGVGPSASGASVFSENFNAWPPAGWLNQDWSNDAQVGCTLERNADGHWNGVAGWARANAGNVQAVKQDDRLVSPVFDVGTNGFTLKFDFDVDEEGDGSIDFAQIIVVTVLGGGFTTCAINNNCDADATELADADSVLWCRNANSFAFGRTIDVPASKASGTIRLMFRYFNDKFRNLDLGYFRVDNLNGDATAGPDVTPPTTTIRLDGTLSCDVAWYDGPVRVVLTATDNVGGSGVASTFYRLDGGGQTTYAGPFTVTGDGAHTVEYWSTDNAGNVEAHKTEAFRIDATPPTTAIDVGEPQAETDRLYVTNATRFTLTADDGAGSGVNRTEFRVDGGDWTPYKDPFSVRGPDGPHTVGYRSGDRACHLEQENGLDVFLDNTPPDVFIESPPTPDSLAAQTLGPLLAELRSACAQALAPAVCSTAIPADAPDLPAELAPALAQLADAAATLDGQCRMVLAPSVCESVFGPVRGLLGSVQDAPEGAGVVTGVVTVRANATDPLVGGGASGVARVDFLLDGALQATDDAAPYEWTWDTSGVERGRHDLRVVAVDRVRNPADAEMVVLVV